MKIKQRPWSKQILKTNRTKMRKEGSCEAEDTAVGKELWLYAATRKPV